MGLFSPTKKDRPNGGSRADSDASGTLVSPSTGTASSCSETLNETLGASKEELDTMTSDCVVLSSVTRSRPRLQSRPTRRTTVQLTPLQIDRPRPASELVSPSKPRSASTLNNVAMSPRFVEELKSRQTGGSFRKTSDASKSSASAASASPTELTNSYKQLNIQDAPKLSTEEQASAATAAVESSAKPEAVDNAKEPSRSSVSSLRAAFGRPMTWLGELTAKKSSKQSEGELAASSTKDSTGSATPPKIRETPA